MRSSAQAMSRPSRQLGGATTSSAMRERQRDRGVDTQALAGDLRFGHRPRLERAYLVGERCRRQRPIELAPGFLQLARVGHADFRLWTRHRAGCRHAAGRGRFGEHLRAPSSARRSCNCPPVSCSPMASDSEPDLVLTSTRLARLVRAPLRRCPRWRWPSRTGPWWTGPAAAWTPSAPPPGGWSPGRRHRRRRRLAHPRPHRGEPRPPTPP